MCRYLLNPRIYLILVCFLHFEHLQYISSSLSFTLDDDLLIQLRRELIASISARNAVNDTAKRKRLNVLVSLGFTRDIKLN